ncbi:MAG TPA: FAD-binding and (Fe-S)-binding domain-containing protein [Marmoricola sp.]|nr:FAD-binding and (Fe-S)-binding domain-containing protein [Marmoricola sp.]
MVQDAVQVPTPSTRNPDDPVDASVWPPATAGAVPDDADLRSLEQDLADRVDGEIRFDSASRGLYSTDASNFRQVPFGVVVPRSTEAGAEAVRVCRDHGVPIVSRGGGTSLAGQCTNAAVVLDFSKYCNRLLSLDVENRRCTVEPGIVLDDLNRELEVHGLRFGPEPATHFNCTIGGMIGNNSCGATAQRTGKTVDNVHALEVMLADGTRFRAEHTDDEEYHRIEARGDRQAEIYRTLRRVRDEYGDLIREKFPDIPRRVSGYNLDSLLPEYGFDIGRFLVGSEGTLVTVLEAELDLVEVLPEKTLVVLGYPDVGRAGDAVPKILEYDPIALEGLDDLLIHDQQLKNLNPDALKELPRGAGFLMVQFGAQDADESMRQAQHMIDELDDSEHAPTVRFFDDPEREHELWLVRESGLAATAEVPHRPRTHEGWEDSAVHPKDLGNYLRDLQGLFEEFGYASDVGPSLYGHFGQACVHTRIPFDLTTHEGVRTYRAFMERAADLCVAYGGSLSGEHGDGQSRGELLPKMFGDELVGVMERVKTLFDPRDLLNPGKLVRPYRLDQNLRLGQDWAPRAREDTFFQFPHDNGSFADAMTRCVGVGKCRQSTHEGNTVMCPSYQVTREEKDATRGRARLLFEMLQGHDTPVGDMWRSEEVRDALDLCLSCKGCKHDCPASVDMATYKAEFLAHHYEGRLRPRADYATGWLPLAARMVHRLGLAKVANAASHTPGLHWLGLKAAGLETDREVPLFADETLQQWFARTHDDARPLAGSAPRPGGGTSRGRVLLWPDTFTNHFHPEIGIAAIRVLERAGWEVTMPAAPVCCGLTWISTGQLETARTMVRRAVAEVAPHVRKGGLVVGLEPSCTTVFRADAPELFPDDRDVLRLRDATVTLAELLVQHTDGWEPPHLPQQGDGEDRPRAVAQVHCHQHAVLGWEADQQLLDSVGIDAEQLASGCCGLAGNFGFTEGHGDVSKACAEQVLLPRLRDEPAETIVLADGFSCRTQIHDLDSGVHEGRHLAEVLDAAESSGHVDGRTPLHRTADPSPLARLGVLAAVAAPLAGAALVSALRHRSRA